MNIKNKEISPLLGYYPCTDDDEYNGYMSDFDLDIQEVEEQPSKQPTIAIQPLSYTSDRCLNLSRNRISTPKHNRNEKQEWMINGRIQEQEQERYHIREQLPDLYPITPEMRHFPSSVSLISPSSNTTITSSINGPIIHPSEKQVCLQM